MTIRSRILGTAAAGVVILGVGLPGLPVGATPDEEGIEQPCFIDCGPVDPDPDDGGGFDPQGPGGFQQCVENENTPGDDCFDQPQQPEEETPDEEVDVADEDAPRHADPNFTG